MIKQALQNSYGVGRTAGQEHGALGGSKQALSQLFPQGRDGQAGGVLDKVLTIVVVPMLIIIGLIVYAKFEGSIDTSTLSTDAQTAINSTNDNTYSGFNLAAVLPIVLAGVAVLGVVIGSFMRMG